MSKDSEYADKSLFICFVECHRRPTPPHPPGQLSYVIRSITLADLLTSSSEIAELRQVASLCGDDLPLRGGCGAVGSKIVFVSGFKANPDELATPEAYVFDTRRRDDNRIVKMRERLNGGKPNVAMAEFDGRLYAVSPEEHHTHVSFEVFDPQRGNWSRLPKYPNYAEYYNYAIVGSNLLMSTLVPEGDRWMCKDPSVCCFDLAAGPGARWRRIPALCNAGPLPFKGQAIAVDLPHSRNWLLFSLKGDHLRYHYKLVVHLMCLDENQEDMTEIAEVKLPTDARPQAWSECRLLHLGGNDLCLVNTCIWKKDYYNQCYKEGMYTGFNVRGAAIPFRFTFDISKVDKDRENSFTVKIQPSRVFEYQLRSDSTMAPSTLGCFIL